MNVDKKNTIEYDSIEQYYEKSIINNDPSLAAQCLKIAAIYNHSLYIEYTKNLFKKFPNDLNINWHIVKILREIGKPHESLMVLQKINKPNEYLWWSNALKNYLLINDKNLAVKCGERIFDLIFKNNNIILPKKYIKTSNTEEFKEGKNNYISFSLFGKSKRYGEGVIDNIKKYSQYLPKWKIIVYIDSNYDKELKEEISQKAIVINKKNFAKYDGLFWRYEAFSLKDAFRVLIRDADSIPSEREIDGIRSWINSGYKYHIIRDHIEHAELILAGLFAGIVGELRINKPPAGLNYYENRWIDQEYLRANIYKKIMHSVYVNDEFYKIELTSEKISNEIIWLEDNHIGARKYR